MQWLNSCYAQWFNWRHRHQGHAFFRRFHSVLKSAEDWRWSSYRAMIGKEPAPAFLTADWLLTEFGVGMEQARMNFAAFIREAE
jgi:hypothetical protein